MIAVIRDLNRGTIAFLGNRDNRWYLILTILFVGVLIVQAVLRAWVYDKSDFNAFVGPAIELKFHGRSPFVEGHYNSYNAFFYCIMNLFAPFARWFAIILWTVISILCYFWTIGLVHHLINGRLPKFKFQLLWAPFAMIFIFFDNIQLGQSNIIMMFAVVAGVYYLNMNKAAKAALSIGFAIAFKTTPLLFGFFLLLKKKFKAAVLTGVFSLFFMICVPMLFYGPQNGIDYFVDWNKLVLTPFMEGGEVQTSNTGVTHTNQSLDAILIRNFALHGAEQSNLFNAGIMTVEQARFTGKVIKLLLVVLLLVVCLKKGVQTGYRLIYQASIFFAAIIIISPASWLNHYIVLLPAMIVAFHEVLNNPKGKKLLLICTLSAVGLIVVSVTPAIQSLSFYFLGLIVFMFGYVLHYFRNFDHQKPVHN